MRACIIQRAVPRMAIATSATTAMIAAVSRTGIAVHYSNYFQDRPVTNGETHAKNKLTTAHDGLPDGTLVKVTNLANGRSVIAMTNRRTRSRARVLIDASRRAADEPGFLREGQAEARIDGVLRLFSISVRWQHPRVRGSMAVPLLRD